jgi:predicted cupin superfamily sugar epimerase
METDAAAVAASLRMTTHPEGGWFAETWRAPSEDGERPVGSAILYLLGAGERSHWHRLDTHEVWHHAAGDPMELHVWTPGETAITVHRLTGDMSLGSVVQAVVPPGAWQTARPLGAWSLVGCIVAPAFEFSGWELAPPDWEPPIR